MMKETKVTNQPENEVNMINISFKLAT